MKKITVQNIIDLFLGGEERIRVRSANYICKDLNIKDEKVRKMEVSMIETEKDEILEIWACEFGNSSIPYEE